MLLRYQMNEPMIKADMLKIIIKDNEDLFTEISLGASEYMEVIFGLDVKEVDLTNHCYDLLINLGLPYDRMLHGEKGRPETRILIFILDMIFMKDNCVSLKRKSRKY